MTASPLADIDIAQARQAYSLAGFADRDIVVCDSVASAKRSLELGKRVILQDALIMMDLPIDVVAESTGIPEAGALHALRAIESGKHVVMIGKEADCAVGPILKHLADKAGVVYTPVDGDQHGLLMGLVGWVRELGLEVICGGKARDGEVVFDRRAGVLRSEGQSKPLSAAEVEVFDGSLVGRTAEMVARRRQILGDLDAIRGWDVAEMTIAANATGLQPDCAVVHCPVVRVTEIPEVLCRQQDGGILHGPAIIDAVSPLRYPNEAGMGGGVFVVVGCANEYSRGILVNKGCISNHRGSAIVITRPHHLCGVETPISILCAGLLGVSTGGSEYLPRFDAVVRTRIALKAGDRLGDDHLKEYEMLMLPAQPLAAGAQLPFYLGMRQRLKADVPAGAILTVDMIDEPPHSVLWELRRQQDRHFARQC